MGFFKKLLKGDWSNPFDNVKSGTKNFFESQWNKGQDVLKGMLPVGAAISGLSFLGAPLGTTAKASSLIGSVASAAKPALPWASMGMDWYNTQQANAASAQQARDQMEFQERMSSTAYQRAMADMQAAGLNPSLAYQQGGATTPGGAAAPVLRAQTAQVLNESLNGVSARSLQASQSLQARAMASQADTAANLNNARAAESLQAARTGLAQELELAQRRKTGAAEEARLRKSIEVLDAEIGKLGAQTGLHSAQAATEAQRERLTRAEAGQAEVTKAAYESGGPLVEWLQQLLREASKGAGAKIEGAYDEAKDRRSRFTPINPQRIQ